MKPLQLDTHYISSQISEERFTSLLKQAHIQKEKLKNKTWAWSDFLGWVDLPNQIEKNLIEDILQTAKKLQEISDIVVVVGIGGSYLGAKAALDMLSPNFWAKKEIIFAGIDIDGDYLSELLEYLRGKNFSVVVISKSGTTTEPAIAFRFLREKLIAQYRENHANHIVAITDEKKWALLTLARENGYKTLVIPDAVGGRYSVLTPVGLLPIAIAGYDIKKLLSGAKDIMESDDILAYGALRNMFYQDGKNIEIQAVYKQKMRFFSEWWKQLYGESEGKDKKWIFPASVVFSSDLHSLGQYIQDWQRNLFITTLNVEKNQTLLSIPSIADDRDGLNYIAGKDMLYVNLQGMNGAIAAHTSGWVPNIVLNIPEINEYYLGQLFYFFEMACGISAYLLGVNPFDQPWVEEYKKNMFALLGKK